MGPPDTLAMPIECDDRDAASAPTSPNFTSVTYVGGPYADRSEVAYEGVLPAAVYVAAERGLYRKSVRCADDGALRYVWVGEEV